MSSVAHRPRKTNYYLITRIVLATSWALLLGIGGVWVALEWPSRMPGNPKIWTVGGVTSVALGQFVFAALVADRLFPRANPWVSWTGQLLSILAFGVGLIVLVSMATGQ
ncbi:MAG: hypothetical protein K2X32_06630 [Phycisphaerales bacterium]|nr:hypothetical protein [Phycisphaerales bacterium]